MLGKFQYGPEYQTGADWTLKVLFKGPWATAGAGSGAEKAEGRVAARARMIVLENILDKNKVILRKELKLLEGWRLFAEA
jgi:hypothetical protein